jgi:hypothetical protein
MSDDSEVTALLKELLILNRAESAPTVESRTVKEIERREKILNCTAASDYESVSTGQPCRRCALSGSRKSIRAVYAMQEKIRDEE